MMDPTKNPEALNQLNDQQPQEEGDVPDEGGASPSL